MQQVEQFEILVLGSGEAGKYLAWEMAKSGRSTGVIERGLIGGSCPNIACLPSKNLIRSAKVAELSRRGGEYGAVTSLASTDMVAMQRHKRDMVDGLVALHLERFSASGAELIIGEGRFIAPKTLEVSLRDGGQRRLTGERVFVNLGTRATIPDIPGLADAQPLTHVGALELDRLPAHLIVLGGGYVGLELAQAFRRFGSQVTVIERGPQLVPREDPDLARALHEVFREEGVEVALGAEPVAFDGRSGKWVRCRARTAEGERTFDGTDLLVAVGRTPNTVGIGLDLAGVTLDARGYIRVDDRLATTAPGVWAMGECAGSPQFTHVAFDDFRIVQDALAGGGRTNRNRLVPFCIFTDPMLARVGLSEVEARRQGVEPRVATLPMSAVLRTRTIGETRGFMKVLVSPDGDQILGFAMLGDQAGEVATVVQVAMLAGLPYTGLRDAILTHPTMAEGLTALLASVPARHTTSPRPLSRRGRNDAVSADGRRPVAGGSSMESTT